MTKSKAKVGMPVAFQITRDKDGVATNLREHLAAKKRDKQKRPVDVLKDHQKYTNCCLICKTFHKYRSDCPKCGRSMHCFGRNVKNPKQGSKAQWRSFIVAYAPRIYDIGKELYPCKEMERWEERNCIGLVHRHPARNADFATRKDILSKWVVKFDQYLDRHHR